MAVARSVTRGRIGGNARRSANQYPDLKMSVTECPTGTMDRGDTTDGHLLDGRVRYAQPRRGFRSGIEPVLLAAAIPARPGSRCWRAAAALAPHCSAWPPACPGVQGARHRTGPGLVALARQNAAANGWPDLPLHRGRHRVAAGTRARSTTPAPIRPITATPARLAGRIAPGRQARGRRACWRSGPRPWRAPLRPRGTLTFILPAAPAAGGRARRSLDCRLPADRHAAAMAEGPAAGETAAAARDQGQSGAVPRAARAGAA